MSLKGVFRNRERLAGYLFITPAIIFFAIFLIYPLFYDLYLSFTKWDIKSKPVFVGFKNYWLAFQNPVFQVALKNTFYYTFFSVSLGLVLGLVLALLVTSKVKFRAFWETSFFLPVITSWVVVGLIWNWMLSPHLGVINYLLSLFGISPQGFLTNAKQAMPVIVLINVWKNVGFYMIIFSAGLYSISDVYYEAATIDGASKWKQFCSITLPLLQPTTLFLIVTSTISSFQVFGQIYVMTQGGPGQSTNVIVFEMYRQAFEFLHIGYASAISYIMFGILVIFALVQFKILGRHVEY